MIDLFANMEFEENIKSKLSEYYEEIKAMMNFALL